MTTIERSIEGKEAQSSLSALPIESGEKMVFKGEVEFDEGPPDNFDPKNPYADPVAFFEYREYLVRRKASIISRIAERLFVNISSPPRASAGGKTLALLMPTAPILLNPEAVSLGYTGFTRIEIETWLRCIEDDGRKNLGCIQMGFLMGE
ncbi:hypothetical protein SUGI_0102830 [Cryptomeria japonica]|nr:hypothetical protein SUGI_0102830 [Cryptomeria japonica]